MSVALTDINEAPTGISLAQTGDHVVPAGFVIDTPRRIGRIDVADDQAGTNNIFLSGPNADKFEIVVQNGETFLNILPGATAGLAAPGTFSVDINVDDPEFGARSTRP